MKQTKTKGGGSNSAPGRALEGYPGTGREEDGATPTPRDGTRRAKGQEQDGTTFSSLLFFGNLPFPVFYS